MLEIRNLNKRYKDGFQLKNISMHLNKGDFAVLFGADDAGKTSIVYHVLGLQHSREGEIYVWGKTLSQLSEIERKKVRFVPDALCSEPLTMQEYLITLAQNFENYEEDDTREMCEYFDVPMDVKFSEMEDFENKLAMVIGALSVAPRILILDEPMNFLDKESAVKLLEFLKFLAKRGMTILITTEKADEVQDYCSRYFYLKDGKIAYSGLVKDIYDSAKAITIKGGDQDLAVRLLGSPVAKAGERVTYLYRKRGQKCTLSEAIGRIAGNDMQIERLTLEEILDKDYRRWI